MPRLLLAAALVASASLATAPAAQATRTGCISLDESCYTYQCPDDATVNERLWWHDTGPIIHLCLL